jgi:hypothetical protein
MAEPVIRALEAPAYAIVKEGKDDVLYLLEYLLKEDKDGISVNLRQRHWKSGSNLSHPRRVAQNVMKNTPVAYLVQNDKDQGCHVSDQINPIKYITPQI